MLPFATRNSFGDVRDDRVDDKAGELSAEICKREEAKEAEATIHLTVYKEELTKILLKKIQFGPARGHTT